MILVLSLVAAVPAAYSESWTGKDKQLHFLGGAGISSLTTLATEKPLTGALVGCGVGLGKELYDMSRPANTASFKDFAVTCLGAGLGAVGTHWVLMKTNEGYKLQYETKF